MRSGDEIHRSQLDTTFCEDVRRIAVGWPSNLLTVYEHLRDSVVAGGRVVDGERIASGGGKRQFQGGLGEGLLRQEPELRVAAPARAESAHLLGLRIAITRVDDTQAFGLDRIWIEASLQAEVIEVQCARLLTPIYEGEDVRS